MRGFDRDLIRGGHYGQRSCEPHLKAEHMAAPTNAANVKKALANSEPSTHGTTRKNSERIRGRGELRSLGASMGSTRLAGRMLLPSAQHQWNVIRQGASPT